MIGSELAAFLQDGVAIHVGTRDGSLQPNGVRAIAVTVEGDGLHAIVYIPKVAAPRVMPDLRANGEIAVVFARPIDDKACQVKGTFVGARPASIQERARVESQWEAFLANMERIGIPRAMTQAWTTWPAVAIRFRANAVFDQTPGASAGEPLR